MGGGWIIYLLILKTYNNLKARFSLVAFCCIKWSRGSVQFNPRLHYYVSLRCMGCTDLNLVQDIRANIGKIHKNILPDTELMRVFCFRKATVTTLSECRHVRPRCVRHKDFV